MLELVAALVLIPVIFGLAMMLMGLAGFATYMPFLLFDRILERLWGVRHPEPPTYIYAQPVPPPPIQQQQPVVHNHYYLLEQPPSALPLPAPQMPVALEGEWRVVDQPVNGSDEVQRLLSSGTRALARRR